MSYADELSVKLTAKDEMSARLRGVKKELESTTRAMMKARQEFETTGSPEAVAELKRLEAEHKRLAKSYRDTADAAKKARDDYKGFSDGAGKATTAMGRLGQAIEKHQKRIQQAGAIGAAALALFARSSIKAFAEAEKQQVMLEQAYSRFPKMANVSIESMRALNTELMNLTGADDDALAGAEALLARFDLTGQQIAQLIPLVNDYAIATGQDLPSAASTIGKAMLGNAKALKSMGINFKATGDRATDMAAIMAILQEKVGGVGEAFGKSTAGQMAIAQQNFENMKEEIGAALVPILQALVSVLKPVAATISGLPKPLQLAGFMIAALGTALMIATPKIIAFKAALARTSLSTGSVMSGLRGVVGFLGGPWGIALAVAGAALFDYQRQQQETQAKVDSLTEALRRQATEGMRPVAEELVSMFTNWSSGQGTFQEQVDALGLSTKQFVDAVLSGPGAVEELRNKLYALQAQGGQTAGMAQGLIWILNETSGAFGSAKDKADAVEGAMKALGFEIDDTGGAAETAASKVNRLTRAMNRLKGVADRQQALAGFKKAIKDAVEKPSKEAAYKSIDAFNTAFGTYKDGSKAQARFVIRNYDSIVQTIRQSGLSKTLQKQLIDPLVTARQRAEDVMNALMSIDGTNVSIGISGLSSISGYRPMGKPKVQKAAGGAVFGPGTGTSDSIPAMLSNGEFVVRAAASKAIGYDVLARLNQADRVPVLPPIVNAPAISLPDGVGRDAPLIGHAEIHTSGQIDLELALAREARRQDRDRRTRMAGTR